MCKKLLVGVLLLVFSIFSAMAQKIKDPFVVQLNDFKKKFQTYQSLPYTETDKIDVSYEDLISSLSSIIQHPGFKPPVFEEAMKTTGLFQAYSYDKILSFVGFPIVGDGTFTPSALLLYYESSAGKRQVLHLTANELFEGLGYPLIEKVYTLNAQELVYLIATESKPCASCLNKAFVQVRLTQSEPEFDLIEVFDGRQSDVNSFEYDEVSKTLKLSCTISGSNLDAFMANEDQNYRFTAVRRFANNAWVLVSSGLNLIEE